MISNKMLGWENQWYGDCTWSVNRNLDAPKQEKQSLNRSKVRGSNQTAMPRRPNEIIGEYTGLGAAWRTDKSSKRVALEIQIREGRQCLTGCFLKNSECVTDLGKVELNCWR